jgi:hypothetical protein
MDSIQRMEGLIPSEWGEELQAYGLLNLDKEVVKEFFKRVPELFDEWHSKSSQDYEELLYRIYRPYSSKDLDKIDEWMGLETRNWPSQIEFEIILMLNAIRYPDTLLLRSMDPIVENELERISAYLHFVTHVYTIYEPATLKGLAKLGIEIPETSKLDCFNYGAYITSIEMLKELAPFTCFLEHDVPRQRLFQAALAQYGIE